tara:strand:- start:393 stop:572 length:180 start_codon:yes stop_codon:yes gene_type:complete
MIGVHAYGEELVLASFGAKFLKVFIFGVGLKKGVIHQIYETFGVQWNHDLILLISSKCF